MNSSDVKKLLENSKPKQIWFLESQHRKIKSFASAKGLFMRDYILEAVDFFEKKH